MRGPPSLSSLVRQLLRIQIIIARYASLSPGIKDIPSGRLFGSGVDGVSALVLGLWGKELFKSWRGCGAAFVLLWGLGSCEDVGIWRADLGLKEGPVRDGGG